LYLQGIRCGSCEFPLDPTEPVRKLVEGWAHSGVVVMRVDRSGTGDSEGPPCSNVDLSTELATYRAALAALVARPDVDPRRVFLFGQSFGGMLAPLIAHARDEKRQALAGIMVYGTSSLRWRDCIMGTSVRQRRLAGYDDARLEEEMARFREMHDLVCLEGFTPARAFEERPHLAMLRSRDCEGETMYGRHVSLFQQLEAIDLDRAWRAVGSARTPVLALRGEYDWICSRDESATIAAAAGTKACHVELAGVGHDMLAHDDLDASYRRPEDGLWNDRVVEETLAWMNTCVEKVKP
jgi:alpha-beta hydrolase superfamily lysophospholipase